MTSWFFFRVARLYRPTVILVGQLAVLGFEADDVPDLDETVCTEYGMDGRIHLVSWFIYFVG